MHRFSSIAMAAMLAVGCSVDSSHPTRTCLIESDCAMGQTCDRGFCIVRDIDAGVTCTPTNTPCADTGRLGICMPGRMVECDDGTTACRPVRSPLDTELCNGEDDDCDGNVDDGILLTTVENCGACGASCGAGLQCCGDVCIDTTSDDRFCGGCGIEGSQACNTEAGQGCCGSMCHDLLTELDNCGVCGRECPTGQACCGGECVNRDSDPDACGVCGNACADGERCCRGQCSLPGSSRCGSCADDCESMGLGCCDGSCVDLDTDRTYCGSCGRSCAAGEFCCEGACVTSDASHCGACGIVCESGELCCGNSCVANNSPNCGSCGTTCAPGTACCGTGCFDLQADEAHCGNCGTACEEGQTCSNGRCCGAGLTNCGGRCVNLLNDRTNCGSCGNNCALLIIPTACNNGSC